MRRDVLMWVIIGFLINLGLTYFIYLDGQRRGVKKLPLWTCINLFIPFLTFLVYLLVRPKNIITVTVVKSPYGFRSRNIFNMIKAMLAFMFIFTLTFSASSAAPGDVVNHLLSPQTGLQAGNTNTPNNSTPGTVMVLPQGASMSQGRKVRVHYLDVGKGDAILIQLPNGKNMLIDAAYNKNCIAVLSYLQTSGVNKLDYCIFTQPSEDHIGGAASVIESFDIGQVIMPQITSKSKEYNNLLTAMANKGLTPVEAKAGLTLDLGSQVSAQLVAPNRSGYADLNNYSAVLRLVYGKTSFLFDGDALAQSEQEMIKAGWDIKADVLKIGNHGSSLATTAEFLAKVHPQYAIISTGLDNDKNPTAKKTLDRLTKAGIKILRTDQDGTIVTESDGTTIKITKKTKEVQSGASSSTTQSSVSSSSQAHQ